MDFLIRRYRQTDQAEVLKIWHKESLNSHPFIPAQFWAEHLESIKNKYLPEANTYVAEREGRILGFISLMGNYVGALFVDEEYQRRGIGRALLEFAHKSVGSIFVDVYKENTYACEFYRKFGFEERREKIQKETGQVLITMYLGANSHSQ